MTEKSNVALGALLVGLRRSAGLTQEDVADRTQLTVRAIGDLEGGRVARPRRSTVARLADVLGPDPVTARQLWSVARPVPGATPRPVAPDDAAAAGLTEAFGAFLRALDIDACPVPERPDEEGRAVVVVHFTVSVTCDRGCSGS